MRSGSHGAYLRAVGLRSSPATPAASAVTVGANRLADYAIKRLRRVGLMSALGRTQKASSDGRRSLKTQLASFFGQALSGLNGAELVCLLSLNCR